MAELHDVDSVVRQVEDLLEELSHSDPVLRDTAAELIRLLMQLYGAGLSRVMEVAQQAGARELAGQLADDKLIGSLLLLHGLHPKDTETRVREALHRVQKRLDLHSLVLEEISDGVARIRIERNGRGDLPAGLRETIEEAVADCAPELAGVEVEGLAGAGPLVQIEMAQGR